LVTFALAVVQALVARDAPAFGGADLRPFQVSKENLKFVIDHEAETCCDAGKSPRKSVL